MTVVDNYWATDVQLRNARKTWLIGSFQEKIGVYLPFLSPKLCCLCEISLAPSSEKQCVRSFERETDVGKLRPVYQSNFTHWVPLQWRPNFWTAETAETDLLPNDGFFMLKLLLQIDHLFISRVNAQAIWRGILYRGLLMDHGTASGVYLSVLGRKRPARQVWWEDGQ